MNRQQKGKKFEKKAYRFLKSKFDKVIWLSKENAKAPVDFECYKKDKKVMVEAKSEKYLCLKRNKNVDFFVTNIKNKIKLLSFDKAINSRVVNKTISITEQQENYIKQNFMNLSRFVQNKLKEIMTEKKVKYGCASCDFSSNDENDFKYVKGDVYHYCKDCIKKFKLKIKKDKREVKK